MNIQTKQIESQEGHTPFFCRDYSKRMYHMSYVNELFSEIFQIVSHQKIYESR